MSTDLSINPQATNVQVPLCRNSDFGTCFNCNQAEGEFKVQTYDPQAQLWVTVPYCRNCFADIALHMLNDRSGYSCYGGSA